MITPTGTSAGSPAPPVITPIAEAEQDIAPDTILPAPVDEPVDEPVEDDTTEID